MNDTLMMRWLGTAGLVLSYRGHAVAIDPFVTRPRMRYLLSGRPEADCQLACSVVPFCGVILVSHAHYDHLMDVPSIARSTGATVLGSRNTCLLLSRLEVASGQLRRVEPGDCEQLPPFAVAVWPGDHPTVPGFTPGAASGQGRLPLRLRDYRMDTCLSFLVQVAGLRVYICNASRITSAPSADVLCVSMARTESYYRVLLDLVRPRLVIPVHWDDLFRPLSEPPRPFWSPPRWGAAPFRRLNPAGFARDIERIGIGRVLLPQPLVDYDLGRLVAG